MPSTNTSSASAHRLRPASPIDAEAVSAFLDRVSLVLGLNLVADSVAAVALYRVGGRVPVPAMNVLDMRLDVCDGAPSEPGERVRGTH